MVTKKVAFLLNYAFVPSQSPSANHHGGLWFVHNKEARSVCAASIS